MSQNDFIKLSCWSGKSETKPKNPVHIKINVRRQRILVFIFDFVGSYMSPAPLSEPIPSSFRSPQTASPPPGRRTCYPFACPKPSRAEGTTRGPDLSQGYRLFKFIFLIERRPKVISLLNPTCVVMPDAYFPDFSQIGVGFYLEVVQPVPLKGSFSLQVTWATFV